VGFASTDMTAITTANLRFVIGAIRANSGTSLSVAVARLKIEYR